MTHYIDTRKLISDIQMRPALWNRNYAVNKAFTEDTWDELAEIHSLPSMILSFMDYFIYHHVRISVCVCVCVYV